MRGLKAAFFTEAGSKRGMGHLVRTHAILEYFKKMGVFTTFFLDSDVNYDYKYNDINYFKWAKFSLCDYYDIIFIDSYEADLKIYQSIQKQCKVAVYIDDFSRVDYPEGVIINFAPKSYGLLKKDKKHTLLLGYKYLPFRSTLQDVVPQKKEQILIMMGGSDVKNLSYDIAAALLEIPYKKIVVSNNQAMLKKIQNLHNAEILYQPNDDLLVKIMADSSLAISTASMGAYELAYLHIPTLIIAVAQNQREGIKQFLKNNIAQAYVDIYADNFKEKLIKEVRELLKMPTIYNSLIDGFGTQRIYEKIIALCEKF